MHNGAYHCKPQQLQDYSRGLRTAQLSVKYRTCRLRNETYIVVLTRLQYVCVKFVLCLVCRFSTFIIMSLIRRLLVVMLPRQLTIFSTRDRGSVNGMWTDGERTECAHTS